MTTFGLALPTMHPGARREVIEAAADVADRLGWRGVWTTDHVLVPHGEADEYGRIYEVLITLAWVAALKPGLELGTSVIVVPQRNAVVLAKELATLDDLSGGRLRVGVGAGWVEGEFENLGEGRRYHQRGAYLDETIGLWRHLWSGSTAPFAGRFHRLSDFLFEPLPAQRERLPILIGGPSQAALKRAAVLGDGYQSAVMDPASYELAARTIEAAARAAARPMPQLSARLNVRPGGAAGPLYSLCGSTSNMLRELRAFIDAGVDEFVLHFEPRDPDALVHAIERFDSDIVQELAA
jgi:probable F420-dependent oxidoreductase